jgi:hypothetical protein
VRVVLGEGRRTHAPDIGRNPCPLQSGALQMAATLN